MKRLSALLILGLINYTAYSQTNISESAAAGQTALTRSNMAPEIAIIPEPVSLTKGEGHFVLPENVVINRQPCLS